MNSTQTLAHFAASFPTADIPIAVEIAATTLLLDNVATMVVGVAQPVHGLTAAAVVAATGGGSYEALGGTKVPFSSAVFLDGVAAGCFEFEHVVPNAHPSSTVFPALLALATRERCSGRDLLAAMVIGYELAARIGTACGPSVESERGFHNPGLNGTLASAAACARLLKLDATMTASAIGIAASSAAGLLAFVNTGAMTKRLHPGRAAQLGLESAFLAQSGVVGPEDVIENPLGFLHAFSPKPHPEALIWNLGRDWHAANMIIKLSPVHEFAQNFVHAVNGLRDAGRQWTAQQVGDVSVRVGPGAANPTHHDTEPETLVAGQYSVPFCIAVALARDLRNPLVFDDSVVRDSDVRAIAKRIHIEQTFDDPRQVGGSLTISFDGSRESLDATQYPGVPGNSGYNGAVKQKFMRAVRALQIEHSEDILRTVAGTLDAPNLDRFAAVLRSAAASVKRAAS